MRPTALRVSHRNYLLIMMILLQLLLLVSCTKFDFHHPPIARHYASGVAVDWINLQQKLTQRTPGFGPGPTGRAFAYTGVTMYEAVLPAVTSFHGLVRLQGISLPMVDKSKPYFWPASVNGSMKKVMTSFFAAANIDPAIAAANRFSIDSLYMVYEGKFESQCSEDILARSSSFGELVGKAVFDYSVTDGTFAVNPPYVAPTGAGLWIPTPPGFAPPVSPYGGTLRSFIPDILSRVTVPSPIPYSTDKQSEYYKQAKFVYDKSLILTADEIAIAKTWGDIPGNYNGPAHFTNVLTQLIAKEKLDLYEAAELYARHGIAIYDAIIIIFKAKYQYNGLRPITYIRANFPGAESWNTVIPTPPHPEYLSAHAVIVFACAEVLQDQFGPRYYFKDYTHEALYGVRSYKSFREYAQESAWSRVLAGIHYGPTATASEQVGKDIGRIVVSLGRVRGPK